MPEFVVFKPTAPQKKGVHGLAPRPDSLNGKTVGLLFNAKVNGDVYLERVREVFQDKYRDVKFVYRSKPTASKPMEPEVFEDMRRCHVVVNAFGD
jgi:hypothetical protein